MIEKIKHWVDENKESIKSTYNYLHSNAEISWKEEKTTEYLCSQLKMLDIPFKTFDDHTGVIGYWGNEEEGPVIGLRADIDALWQIVDGEWKANHSCGHDAHMTMVLYTITCLKEIGFYPKGLLKIIFQPAEESGKGAQALIEKGVMNDVDYLLGIHVRPIQELTFGQASPAIYHGATTLLKGRIEGIQAHGSRPNQGINVVDSLGAIIQAVNSVKIDPTVSASAKVTMVQAGGNNINIIPDYAEFGIDIRAQDNHVLHQLIEQIEHAILYAGSANRAKVEVETLAAMVAAEPSPEMEELVKAAIVEALGEDALAAPPVTPGGEDFHFYKSSFPHIQATMVGLGTDLQPGLHHPNMSFNLDSLQNGVKVLAISTLKLLQQEEICTKVKETKIKGWNRSTSSSSA
ncbi:amidohydrolase [Bacillus aerolatus]|uniref:Amidohydrolase n=1 Tax=Bacillus aerolatus TaxID=2653354 RepID=A0A6I1FFG7_9BACI|nr:M20 peptidase aminoacylase family protein [Bacillus aerolatus]KAB7706706.1 amidohydrolase [Bacillus aerolatus]